MRERTEEQVRQLVQRAQNRPDQVMHRGFEEEAQALRRRAQTALEALGELDTPEKQELSRRIQAQLDQQIQDLRNQLVRRAHAAAPQSSAQEAAELRRRAQGGPWPSWGG